MTEVVRQIGLGERRKVEVAGAPIETAPPVPLPRAGLPVEPGCPRPYCTAELNSRLPATLPAAPWKVRWQAGLNTVFPAEAVVEGAGKILAQGGGLWQLFDFAGTKLAQGRYSRSNAVLDAARSLFYAMDRSNALAAYRLSDGAFAFMTSPTYGDIFARPYLARRGNRLLIVGVETEAFPHRPAPPNRSVVEYIEFSEPLQTHPSGFLTSVTGDGQLHLRTARLAAAMRDDTFVLAIPGRIYLADISLNVQRAFDGDFEPVLMSLDEAGRIYLVALVGEDKALWILSPEGKRLGAFPLKPEHQALIAPPIVGYDHRIYLLTRALVVALDAAGKLLWERPTGGAAGAGVTADDRLLISAGEELAVFDPNGERRVLYRFRGEPLTTPPVLTAEGQILVASAQRLYCLAR